MLALLSQLTLNQYWFCAWFGDDKDHKAIFALLALCAGNSSVIGDFPAQRPVTQDLDVFIDLRVNKRLS